MPTIEDADRLRRNAAVLNQRSTDLNALAARLDAKVATMAYAGPSADRFRSGVAEQRRTMDRAAADLRGIADTMIRSAMEIEASPTPRLGPVC